MMRSRMIHRVVNQSNSFDVIGLELAHLALQKANELSEHSRRAGKESKIEIEFYTSSAESLNDILDLFIGFPSFNRFSTLVLTLAFR